MYLPEDGPEQVKSGYADVNKMDPALIARTRANYSGAVTMCDRWLGYFIEQMRVMGLLENTAVILTTDHGSMLCQRALQVRGNRDTSNNVRYKFGDNLGVDEDKIFLMKDPEQYRLPKQSTIENYAISTGNHYLVYPTNFHEYERLYRDSFQHGGISMEEVLCPFIVMRPR